MDLEEIFNFGGTDEKYRVLPWHKRVWYGKIKPSLALPVPCKIYLRDWRLGLGRMCLQVPPPLTYLFFALPFCSASALSCSSRSLPLLAWRTRCFRSAHPAHLN
jgi:hypothetical protein